MVKLEKMMLVSYWDSTGGVLIDPFLVAISENLERIEADGLIVHSDKKKKRAKAEDQSISDKPVTAVFTIDGSPSLTIIGKAHFCRKRLLETFKVKSAIVVILCTKGDSILQETFALGDDLSIRVFEPVTGDGDQDPYPKVIGGQSFDFACNIEPLRNSSTGIVKEFYPDQEFRGNLSLHKHGKGPFCVFTIPVTAAKKKGIYILLVDEQVKYIGFCDDLYEKFHFEFGHIQPRDCYWGGHPERCRVNHLILKAAQEGKEIKLAFSNQHASESKTAKLIWDLKPQWNIHGKRVRSRSFSHLNIADGTMDESDIDQETEAGLGKRYRRLTDHLKKTQGDEIVLGFEEIETINGRKLPPSAYKYTAWWANGDRPQAISWLAAGWRVKRVDLGKSVVFRRVDR